MGGLFSTPKVKQPAQPAKVRMPVETDPDILAASQRTRQSAMQRAGRMSTILTDTLSQTGSSGKKLGA